MTYVDSTSLTRWERRAWIKLAELNGATPEALFFDVPLEICKERNRRRHRTVPDDAMDMLAARLVPPSLDEGFARITVLQVSSIDAGPQPIAVLERGPALP